MWSGCWYLRGKYWLGMWSGRWYLHGKYWLRMWSGHLYFHCKYCLQCSWVVGTFMANTDWEFGLVVRNSMPNIDLMWSGRWCLHANAALGCGQIVFTSMASEVIGWLALSVANSDLVLSVWLSQLALVNRSYIGVEWCDVLALVYTYNARTSRRDMFLFSLFFLFTPLQLLKHFQNYPAPILRNKINPRAAMAYG